MGFLDFSGSIVPCPVCGARRAKKSFWKIKCVNPNCAKYDSDYAAQANLSRITGKSATEVFPHLQGSFSPRVPFTLQYENFRGDQLTYLADVAGAYRTGDHLVIRVAPTGRRVAFLFSAIKNRPDLEGHLSQGEVPVAQERRILNFHLRRGTTSAIFLELRKKYPDYEL